MEIKGVKISKKLTVTILGLVVVLLHDYIGLTIPDSVVEFIQNILLTYLAGQSAVDVSKTLVGKRGSGDTVIISAPIESADEKKNGN